MDGPTWRRLLKKEKAGSWWGAQTHEEREQFKDRSQ